MRQTTCLQASRVAKVGGGGWGGGGEGDSAIQGNPSTKSAGLPTTTKDFEKASAFLMRLGSKPFHAC